MVHHIGLGAPRAPHVDCVLHDAGAVRDPGRQLGDRFIIKLAGGKKRNLRESALILGIAVSESVGFVVAAAEDAPFVGYQQRVKRAARHVHHLLADGQLDVVAVVFGPPAHARTARVVRVREVPQLRR